MQPLNLPAYDVKISQSDGKRHIYDTFRKVWVVLTPEEWVRQHFLMWLVTGLNYPAGLIGVEISLNYNKLKKRADAVVYDKNGKALMLIECKAPGVAISQSTFDQALRYNFTLQTAYLAMTNGFDHYCCKLDLESGKTHFLQEIPDYNSIADMV